MILHGCPAPYRQRKGRTGALTCSQTLSIMLGTPSEYLGEMGRETISSKSLWGQCILKVKGRVEIM